MQLANILERVKSETDERLINIKLTDKGWQLKKELSCIPKQLISQTNYDTDNAMELKSLLEQLISQLK
jgi:DNA-binding MarR family transcriptional regulator